MLYLEKLGRYLDEERPIYGLQPDSRAAEHLRSRTVEEMARDYVAEMRTVQPTGPYVLIGSCFGGLVAHEMGRLLDDDGERLDLLLHIDPPTPGWQGQHSWQRRWSPAWLLKNAQRRIRRMVVYPKRLRIRLRGTGESSSTGLARKWR